MPDITEVFRILNKKEIYYVDGDSITYKEEKLKKSS